ncbi:DUF397 domain-containing protein [Streptomyces xiamenensis]|uniref:DUF397 domain-containing protein n=1 Tax=Streptomyces xiamenensis TaxID=408015 RepID=A0A0F7FUV1_9ACTN|nr:DUF397 domain-containing protein [Streptomyces xiamenensis]AKG43622.1 protein of unknown function DUF397 [Streptomyces xiamenensis]
MMRRGWQKSSYSSGDPNTSCLEATRTPEGCLRFRESEDPGTVLVTTPARWAALLRAAGSGATH